MGLLSQRAVRSPEIMQQSVSTPTEPSPGSFYIRGRGQPTAPCPAIFLVSTWGNRSPGELPRAEAQ
jgi:hypothetical protein